MKRHAIAAALALCAVGWLLDVWIASAIPTQHITLWYGPAPLHLQAKGSLP